MQIYLEDFRSEGSDEMFRKGLILLLHGARQLGGVTEAMEETTEDAISPLLRLPPLAALTFLLILGHGVWRNLEVDDLEEEISPRHQALPTLLVCTQMNDNAGFVRLENQVEYVRDLLRGIWRWRGEQTARNVDQGREQLRNQSRENVRLLAEPICRKLGFVGITRDHRCSPECPHHFQSCHTTSCDLANASVVQIQQTLHLHQQPRPSIREVASNNILERVCKLKSDASGGRYGQEAKETLLESITVRLRDGDLIRTRVLAIDGVGAVDTVLQVDGTCLSSGPARFLASQNARLTRFHTHRSTLSLAIISRRSLIMPS